MSYLMSYRARQIKGSTPDQDPPVTCIWGPALVVIACLCGPVLAAPPAKTETLPAAPSADQGQARSPDGKGIDQLAKSGSDLSQLHHVDFFLHFPTQKSAERAASRLEAFAFATKVERGKSGQWVVEAAKVMYPVESDLSGLRDKLNAIAAEEHGAYDGWQARIKE
jgi:hypothetical protein